MKFTSIAHLLLAAAVSAAPPAPPAPPKAPAPPAPAPAPPAAALPAPPPPLNDLIKKKGKTYFGTATDFWGGGSTGEVADKQYQTLLNNTHLFGQQTPGNVMKWGVLEPTTEGQYNYGPADAFVAYAKANNQLIRCHNLVWNSQLPTYITDRNWTAADNQTLQAIMKEHITTEVNRYKDVCYAWDVVNEPLNDGDGSFREGPFLSAIGPDYVAIAFKLASDAVKATGKNIKLYVNEYNDEYAGPKATQLMNLVSNIKSRGIQLDGVGFESHFIVGETPDRAAQASVKQQFANLGVDVAVTELDVRFSALPPSQADLQQQATDYVNSVGSCLDVKRCVGVTVWDFQDKYSWIPGTFPGSGDADFYNSNYTTKPALQAVANLLM